MLCQGNAADTAFFVSGKIGRMGRYLCHYNHFLVVSIINMGQIIIN